MSKEPRPRPNGGWADKAETVPVGGREMRLTGPLQGFGKMWQKTFRIRLDGCEATPEEVIAEWKTNYGSFWPSHARFYAPITGIKPGEVAVIGTKQGPMRVSTGVMVMYADDVSFAYMTPEGHPFAGWITFSAEREEETTVAQVRMILRASDPIYELGFTFGGSRAENRMWQQTLRALAAHLGVDAEPQSSAVCVDKHRQWRNFGQVWQNSMIRSTLAAPFRAIRGNHEPT